MSFLLVSRVPTVEEYMDVCISSGLILPHRDVIQHGLECSTYAVCAVDGSAVIGFARIVGDGAIFFEIVDVGVRVEWQRRGIGSALIQNVLTWLKNNAHPSSFVSLTPNKGARPFYERLGFVSRDSEEIGMTHPKWAHTMKLLHNQ
jgi:GNAT superfamily N-acetyltransferase